MADLVLRTGLGRPLTSAEADSNITELAARAGAAQATASTAASAAAAAGAAATQALAAAIKKFEIHDGTATSNFTGNTTENIIRSYLIPATREGISGNTLANAELTFLAQFEKLIGYTADFKIYLSDSPTNISGTSLAQFNSVAGTGYQPIMRTIKISAPNGSGISTVTIFNNSVTANGEVAATYQVSTMILNPSTPKYLILTGKNGNAAGWFKLHQFKLEVNKHTQ